MLILSSHNTTLFQRKSYEPITHARFFLPVYKQHYNFIRVPSETPLFSSLTVEDLLTYASSLHGCLPARTSSRLFLPITTPHFHPVSTPNRTRKRPLHQKRVPLIPPFTIPNPHAR